MTSVSELSDDSSFFIAYDRMSDFLTAYFSPPDSIDHQDEEGVESAAKLAAEASRCQFVSHITLLNTPNGSSIQGWLKGILTSTILSPSTCTSRSRS